MANELQLIIAETEQRRRDRSIDIFEQKNMIYINVRELYYYRYTQNQRTIRNK